MSRCAKCGEWLLDYGKHECPPAWIVWCPEWDQTIHDTRPTFAYGAESAAEKWAESEDAGGDYTIISGDEPEVCVALRSEYDRLVEDDGRREPPEGLEVRRFVVAGESVPHYHAREVE